MPTPQPKYNNAAGRLLMVFEKALSEAEGTPYREAWGRTLGIEPKDNIQLYRALPVLHQLLDEVRGAVEESEWKHKSLLLQHLPSLGQAISPNGLSEQWGQYRQSLTPAAMMAIELCAIELPANENIAEEELERILAQLDDLFLQVKGTQMDAELKRWILEILNTLMLAIRSSWITGADGLRRATSYACAEMARHAADLKKEENQWWGKRLWEACSAIDEKVAQALKWGKRIEAASNFVTKYLGFDAGSDGPPKISDGE